MIRYIRNLLSKPIADFQPGDFVRRVGLKGVAWVESVTGEYATIGFAKDRREIWSVFKLRRVRPCGHSLDKR